MLEQIGLWLAPFSFISGVGLLVLSTANRYTRLKTVIFEYQKQKQFNSAAYDKSYLKHELKRAILMRNSLICLYSAIAIICLGSVASIIPTSEVLKLLIVQITMFLVVVMILFVSGSMIYESTVSLNIMRGLAEAHLEDRN
jgi:hypothetical protein